MLGQFLSGDQIILQARLGLLLRLRHPILHRVDVDPVLLLAVGIPLRLQARLLGLLLQPIIVRLEHRHLGAQLRHLILVLLRVVLGGGARLRRGDRGRHGHLRARLHLALHLLELIAQGVRLPAVRLLAAEELDVGDLELAQQADLLGLRAPLIIHAAVRHWRARRARPVRHREPLYPRGRQRRSRRSRVLDAGRRGATAAVRRRRRVAARRVGR